MCSPKLLSVPCARYVLSVDLHTFPYASFSSSRMMEALTPLGVPHVRSSMPLLALRPVGRSPDMSESFCRRFVEVWKGALREALMDGDKSEDIWDAVLKDGGIRSVFRIVPTRNTDFAHLKDGFIRQVTGKTQHFSSRRNDQSFGDESFGQSMNSFKDLFGAAPRKQLPKGEILLLTRDARGKLGAWYEDPKGSRTRFGPVIDDERISRLVWLQYLSGKNPSSHGARKSIVDGVMEYVERPVGTVSTQVV